MLGKWVFAAEEVTIFIGAKGSLTMKAGEIDFVEAGPWMTWATSTQEQRHLGQRPGHTIRFCEPVEKNESNSRHIIFNHQ